MPTDVSDMARLHDAARVDMSLRRRIEFPYCGTLIDPKTLDVRIDISRSYSHSMPQSRHRQVHCNVWGSQSQPIASCSFSADIRETFKVEVSRKPGVTFTLWLKR